MKKQPLVSVVMPVYNGSRFVGKAIESILNQTYTRWELLVADSGSGDNTWEILKKYKRQAPKKIRLLRLHKNGGAFSAANVLFQFAKGDYIAPMDADDVSNRQRFTKEASFLQTHPDVILVGSNARIIDARGRGIGFKTCPNTNEEIYRSFALVNPIIHPSCMIRRSLLPQRDFLYYTNFGVNSDYYTFFDWFHCGKFANIPEYLLSYRIHGANSSLTDIKEKFWTITKIRLAAITKLNYKAPLLMFPAIAVQALLVALLPETVLRELFFYLRGIKRIKLPRLVPYSLRVQQLRKYALTSR